MASRGPNAFSCTAHGYLGLHHAARDRRKHGIGSERSDLRDLRRIALARFPKDPRVSRGCYVVAALSRVLTYIVTRGKGWVGTCWTEVADSDLLLLRLLRPVFKPSVQNFAVRFL